MLSVSGHKLNGPKGTGFLYVNQEVKLSPILLGESRNESAARGRKMYWHRRLKRSGRPFKP